MGFRFRQGIRIVNGVRLNIGKTGASLSIGGRGATVNVGKKGIKGTVGMPGSGISYNAPLSANDGNRRRAPRTNNSGGAAVLMWVFLIIGFWYVFIK